MERQLRVAFATREDGAKSRRRGWIKVTTAALAAAKVVAFFGLPEIDQSAKSGKHFRFDL